MSSHSERKVTEMIEVRRQLTRWAEWLRAGNALCKGYPNSTAFSHADEIVQTTVDYGASDPEILKVEQAMCLLKGLNNNVFRVLLYDYYHELTNREGAQRLKISEPTYKTWRTNGEYFIAGQIT